MYSLCHLCLQEIVNHINDSIMNKKTVGILSAALLVAGGLILQNLYKRKKLKGLEDGLEPLKKGGKKLRKVLENAHNNLSTSN